MPIVRFRWSPELIAVRREACPRARWMAVQRAWEMTAAEAETFIARSHAALDYGRCHTEIAVDGERWLVGFVQGAPCRRGVRS